MKKQKGYVSEETLTLVGLTMFLFIAALIGMLVSSASCHSRWGKSGLEVSWGPIQGCIVKMPSGRWMPEDRIRDVDLDQAKKEK